MFLYSQFWCQPITKKREKIFMLRAFKIIFFLAVISFLSLWLAENPGQVRVIWQGYLVETSAAFLSCVIAGIAAFSAFIYRFWNFIRGMPTEVYRLHKESRRRRGYLALSRGLVAVAAGDPGEARQQANRADELLEEPSLTKLLLAQSAQLTGDENAAENFFNEMLENTDTKFLGLRGLFNQAIKKNKPKEALLFVRQAYKLKPESDWVVITLFDLTTRIGLWKEASELLAKAVKSKALSRISLKHSKAVIHHQLSLEALASGENALALKQAKKACREEPEFVPGQIQVAKSLISLGKKDKAAHTLESAWALAPHPDIATAYLSLSSGDEEITHMKAAQKLAKFNPNHSSTLFMLAMNALDAGLWGDARENLIALSSSGWVVTSSYCQLMARLEEAENSDLKVSREWLIRATTAELDPCWVCDDCANTTKFWVAICKKCGGFDKIQWHRPYKTPSLIESTQEDLKLPSIT